MPLCNPTGDQEEVSFSLQHFYKINHSVQQSCTFRFFSYFFMNAEKKKSSLLLLKLDVVAMTIVFKAHPKVSLLVTSACPLVLGKSSLTMYLMPW